MCVANGSRESHLREIKMGVTVIKGYEGDYDDEGTGSTVTFTSHKAPEKAGPTPAEIAEYWRRNTPQLQIVPVSDAIRPTRKSRSMMEIPAALRPAPKPANAAVTYKMAAPAYTH